MANVAVRLVDVVKKFGHRPADETPLHAAIVEGAASVTALALESF